MPKSTNNELTTVSKHFVDQENPLYQYFDDICHAANNLYNESIFFIRQCMTGLKKAPETRFPNELKVLAILRKYLPAVNAVCKKNGTKPFTMPSADKWMPSDYLIGRVFKVSNNKEYRALPAQANQWVITAATESFNSYFEALRSYKTDSSQFTGVPKPPKYRGSGDLMTCMFSNQISQLKQHKDGKWYLKFPKTKLTYELGDFCPKGKFCGVRIVPCHGKFVVEILVKNNVPDMPDVIPTKVMSIDLGVDNIASITDNLGNRPIVIKGGAVKARNQFYNKEVAKYRSLLRLGLDPKNHSRPFTSKRIEAITLNRNNYINDALHKISHFIIETAVKKGIDTIVIGQNALWKQGSSMSKANNQNFIGIPFYKLIHMIKYKARIQGIKVITHEESYTSKASFLDKDDIPIYGDTSVKHTFSGKRVHRGLYQSKDGTLVNADLNGSANIMRKALPKLDISKVDLFSPLVWRYK